MPAVSMQVVEAHVLERDISFRLPFRYGSTVLRAAPEIHVRCRVQFDDGIAEGYSAELAAPKWFDKNPALSNEQNFDQLRDSTQAAARAAVAAVADASPAALSAQLAREAVALRQLPAGNGLIDAYGPSLIDRAVVDAVCRHVRLPLIDVLRSNLPGVDWALVAPELEAPAEDFLGGLRTRDRLAVRHTVGFIDPLWSGDVTTRPDALPVALEEIIAVDGVRYFKIKLSGDAAADIERLSAVAAVLEQCAGDYFVTLDGNEQYPGADALADFLQRAAAAPALARLWARTLLVEQPLARANAFESGIAACTALKPIIIDESDDSADAALQARRAGYAGISVKTCKGFYKSLANAARGRAWPFTVTAEDLSVQAGIALAQNLALWSCLGFEHTERNGHYYGRGPDALPPAERDTLLAQHPDLYTRQGGAARLRITRGDLALGTVNAALGYGAAYEPDRSDMRLLLSVSQR